MIRSERIDLEKKNRKRKVLKRNQLETFLLKVLFLFLNYFIFVLTIIENKLIVVSF